MEKFEKNNATIALSVLHAKKEKTYPVYVLRHNSNCEQQVILLIISNGEKEHEWSETLATPAKSEGQRRRRYPAVKKLSALLRGITSKHYGDFCCMNCFHSFATEDKLESHKKACEKKHFCNVNMPSNDTKILEFNQCQKSDKAPFIIYADLECIIKRLQIYS